MGPVAFLFLVCRAAETRESRQKERETERERHTHTRKERKREHHEIEISAYVSRARPRQASGPASRGRATSHTGLFIRATNKRQDGRRYHAESRIGISNGPRCDRVSSSAAWRCRRPRCDHLTNVSLSPSFSTILPVKFATNGVHPRCISGNVFLAARSVACDVDDESARFRQDSSPLRLRRVSED